MGSKLIWIAAALAYGAVCAAIYLFLQWRKKRPNLLRRAAVALVGYSAFGLAVVYVLLNIFSV
ncbi:MAG: hypothetical protein HDR46_05440 [Bacteroides sp.]|nr:hypothetical protein [Bacteroides sp.]MBD5415715.1 hypothetical protein [Bacteroides sp.]